VIVMYVCICNSVTSSEVKRAIAQADADLENVLETLGVGTGCGSCKTMAREFMRSVLTDNKTKNESALYHAA